MPTDLRTRLHFPGRIMKLQRKPRNGLRYRWAVGNAYCARRKAFWRKKWQGRKLFQWTHDDRAQIFFIRLYQTFLFYRYCLDLTRDTMFYMRRYSISIFQEMKDMYSSSNDSPWSVVICRRRLRPPPSSFWEKRMNNLKNVRTSSNICKLWAGRSFDGKMMRRSFLTQKWRGYMRYEAKKIRTKKLTELWSFEVPTYFSKSTRSW